MKFSIRLAALAVSLAFAGTAATAATAQQEKMKHCNGEAAEKSLKGAERKAFMKECLSSGKDGAAAARQERTKACKAEAAEKGLKGAERKKFVADCQKT